MGTIDSQKIIIQQLSQNLEDLESYIKDLWRFFPLPVCYVNSYQIILDANLALEEFFGWEVLELIGEKAAIFFADKSKAQRIYQEILKKEKTIIEESEVITKKEEKRIANISARRREDDKGNIIGYYLAFFDISKLKQLQEKLEDQVKERTRELQARVEELERFHKLAVGRELKMIELKKEIQALKKTSAEKRVT
jgi:PAS domain S-box-containing protein